MYLSKRQLEAAGEPLGDLTHRKVGRGLICHGGGKGVKPPDYEPLAQVYREIGQTYASIANRQFDMADRRYEESKPTQERITALQMEGQELANRQAQDYYNYSRQTFRPVEQEFARQAMEFNTEDERERLASAAGADVEQALAIQRGSGMRAMSRMGVNPSPNRLGELLGNDGYNAARMRAGAANNARQQAKTTGMTMLGSAAQIGRGMPATSLSAIGTGVGAGSAAAGTMGAADRIGATYTNTGMQALQGQMGAVGGQANMMNTGYQNQMAYDQASGAGAAGIAQLGGMAFSMMSSEKVKEDKSPIPKGKALRALEGMPVEEWKYKDGVEDGGRHIGPYAEDFRRQTGHGDGQTIDLRDQLGITMRAVQDLSAEVKALKSPKGMKDGGYVRGPGTGTSDSVRAINVDTGEPIRLSNGEFVLPASTVRAIGKRKLDELVRRTHRKGGN